MGNLHKSPVNKHKKKGGAPDDNLKPDTKVTEMKASHQEQGPAAQQGPAAHQAPAAVLPNKEQLVVNNFYPPPEIKTVFDQVGRRWDLQPVSSDIGTKISSKLTNLDNLLKTTQETGKNKTIKAVTDAKDNFLEKKNNVLAGLIGDANKKISGGRHTRRHKHGRNHTKKHKHSGHKHSGHKHKHSGHGHSGHGH